MEADLEVTPVDSHKRRNDADQSDVFLFIHSAPSDWFTGPGVSPRMTFCSHYHKLIHALMLPV